MAKKKTKIETKAVTVAREKALGKRIMQPSIDEDVEDFVNHLRHYVNVAVLSALRSEGHATVSACLTAVWGPEEGEIMLEGFVIGTDADAARLRARHGMQVDQRWASRPTRGRRGAK